MDEKIPTAFDFEELRKKFKMSIISNIVLIIIAFVPSIDRWISSEEKVLNVEAQYEIRLQRKVDSFQNIQLAVERKQNENNRDKIYDLMNDMRKELPNSSQIWLFSTTPESVSNPMTMTVLYTADNKEACFPKSWYLRREVPKGYAWFYKTVKDEGFKFLYRVGNEEKMKNDPDTIDDIVCNETYALMGYYIRDIGYTSYFVSVSFKLDELLKMDYRSKSIVKSYGSQFYSYLEPKYVKI